MGAVGWVRQRDRAPCLSFSCAVCSQLYYGPAEPARSVKFSRLIYTGAPLQALPGPPPPPPLLLLHPSRWPRSARRAAETAGRGRSLNFQQGGWFVLTPPSAKFVTAAQTHIRQTVNGRAGASQQTRRGVFQLGPRLRRRLFFKFDQRAVFCNTQDIEVKVQYILHEDGSRVLPTPPRPLCLQAQKNREVAHMLFGLSDSRFFFF